MVVCWDYVFDNNNKMFLIFYIDAFSNQFNVDNWYDFIFKKNVNFSTLNFENTNSYVLCKKCVSFENKIKMLLQKINYYETCLNFDFLQKNNKFLQKNIIFFFKYV